MNSLLEIQCDVAFADSKESSETVMHTFSKLQTRLTISYMLVSALVFLTIAIIFFIFIGFQIFTGTYLPDLISTEILNRTTDLVSPLADQQGQEAVSDWVAEQERQRNWRINDGSLTYIIDFTNDDAILSVFNDEVTLLASSNAMIHEADTRQMVVTSLTNDIVTHQWLVDDLLIAVPVIDDNDNIVGAVAIHMEDARQWGAFFTAIITFIVPSILIIMVISALLGLIIGYFVSKNMITRLNKILVASEAWGAGNFIMIDDDQSDELSELIQRLNEMAQQLEDYVSVQEQIFRWQERQRFGRDLHDSIKQQAFAASSQLAAAKNYLPDQLDTSIEHLGHAEDIVDQLRVELNAMINNLRPPNLINRSLSDAIIAYSNRWARQTQIELELNLMYQISNDTASDVNLFRIVQEALANIERHSQATRVKIELHQTPYLVLTIEDDGQGFDVATTPQGNGLQSIQERALEIGATALTRSTLSQGTIIEVRRLF